MSRDPVLDTADEAIYQLRTTAEGPKGSLPLTPELLKGMSSGDLFGWTQNAGMGWNPAQLLRRQLGRVPAQALASLGSSPMASS